MIQGKTESKVGNYKVFTIPQMRGRKEMQQDSGDENENGLLDGRNHTKGDSVRLDRWLN